MIQMTNQSTKDRGIPDKSPKTDFTIPYLPSESIFKSKHEKTIQMETDFSAAKTRNSNSDFLGPRNYRATAMHHGKWEWVFKLPNDFPVPLFIANIVWSIEKPIKEAKSTQKPRTIKDFLALNFAKNRSFRP